MPDPPPGEQPLTPFIELQSVDSTNNYARRLINASGLTAKQETSLHGIAIFAHEQLKGKGQRGNEWLSEKGANLVLSVIINPSPLLLSDQFKLIACAGLSLYNLLVKYAGPDLKIKWPNDLYWQDRKAGGILIETVIRGEDASTNWDWAIVGMGVNINQTRFPAQLKNPVSLKQITGKEHDPLILARELQGLLLNKFETLSSGGNEDIFEEYNHALYKKGHRVKFKKDNRIFEAVINRVSSTGDLVVTHAIEESFAFGTLEWVL